MTFSIKPLNNRVRRYSLFNSQEPISYTFHLRSMLIIVKVRFGQLTSYKFNIAINCWVWDKFWHLRYSLLELWSSSRSETKDYTKWRRFKIQTACNTMIFYRISWDTTTTKLFNTKIVQKVSIIAWKKI